MSITLRDAQHLCWKTFKKLNKGDSESQSLIPVEDLIAKTQELAIKLKSIEKPISKAEFGRLFSELFYFVFIIAEYKNVDLEESFMQTIDELILDSVI